MKMQVPDHEHAIAAGVFRRCVFLAVFGLLVAGCGGGDRVRSERGAPSLPGNVSIAEPRFVTGGGPADVAIACGSSVRRLSAQASSARSTEIPLHDYLAVSFDPSGNGSRAVVRTDLGPVVVENGQAVALPGWSDGTPAGAAAFSPDGKALAVAASRNDGSAPALVVWRVPLAAWMTIPGGDLGVVTLMAWSDDGKSLLVADRNNRLSIFRPPKTKPVFTQEVDPGAEGTITAIDLSPDGDWFLMAANAAVIRAWQLPFMSARLKPWGRVENIFFAGDVGQVVTIDETNVAMHWLVNYGNVRPDTTEQLSSVVEVGVPAGGEHFYVLGADGRVQAFRSTDLKPLGEVEAVECQPAARDSTPAAPASPATLPGG